MKLRRTTVAAAFLLALPFAAPVRAQDAAAAAPAPEPIEAGFELNGVMITVASPNAPTGNTLDITPIGLRSADTPVHREISGEVAGAEIADLDGDDWPEIYVYVREPGPEARVTLIAYAANKKLPLTEVRLPALESEPGAAVGYQGHDDFVIVKKFLVRRFPIYGSEADPTPTGRTRQLQYRLRRADGGWELQLDRMAEL